MKSIVGSGRAELPLRWLRETERKSNPSSIAWNLTKRCRNLPVRRKRWYDGFVQKGLIHDARKYPSLVIALQDEIVKNGMTNRRTDKPMKVDGSTLKKYTIYFINTLYKHIQAEIL